MLNHGPTLVAPELRTPVRVSVTVTRSPHHSRPPQPWNAPSVARVSLYVVAAKRASAPVRHGPRLELVALTNRLVVDWLSRHIMTEDTAVAAHIRRTAQGPRDGG